MEKISPLHVSDAMIAIAAGCHGCGGTSILVDYVHGLYSLVAFQLTRK
jgi:hypothetical protein